MIGAQEDGRRERAYATVAAAAVRRRALGLELDAAHHRDARRLVAQQRTVRADQARNVGERRCDDKRERAGLDKLERLHEQLLPVAQLPVLDRAKAGEVILVRPWGVRVRRPLADADGHVMQPKVVEDAARKRGAVARLLEPRRRVHAAAVADDGREDTLLLQVERRGRDQRHHIVLVGARRAD